MAEAADKPPEKPKAAGGLVGWLIQGAVVFVLSLAAVILGGAINARLHPVQELILDADGNLTLKPEEKKPPAGAAEEHGGKSEGSGKPAAYFSFDPPLIVNFDDTQAVRFLQVQIDVMAREEKALEAVKLHSPVIRNNLLMVMNGRDYKTLMSREGKEALRQDCLKEVQKILKKETGSPGIEDLYFTSFVVQ
jgi:flagellar FliL protein